MAESSSQHYTALPGSERKLVPGAQVIGPADPSEVMQVTIRVRSRHGDSASVDEQIAQQGALRPGERTYLTPEQYDAQYGADQSDIDQVAAFAREHQLAIVDTNLSARTITLSGTTQQMANAFRVKLLQYDSPRGQYRGRIGHVHVPTTLKDIIMGVFGLDNREQARPHIILPLLEATKHLVGEESTHHKQPARHHAVNPQSYSPPQVAGFYNFPQGLDGTGQCIGILEFGGGFSQADLTTYFQGLNLPMPQVTAVSADGTPNQPGADPEADGEVLLDIEVAGAVAPGARIVVYFAQFTEQGWVKAVTTAIHDTQNKPSVLSISWGFTEGQDIWTSQAVQTVNQAFQAAALLGISVCCASGDDGSEDQLADGHAHVDFPASSPYVLACGGSSLQVTDNALSGETVWNNGPRTAPGGGSSGGGISDMNAQPSWQTNIPPSVNPGHPTGRGVPDVAANADENSGYTILVDGKTLTGVGGTSAAAPLWAGLIACMNQKLSQPAGFFNPLLYSQLGAANGVFHDITSGNNDPTNGLIGGYPAGAGWDACTGWGSPNGTNLLNAL